MALDLKSLDGLLKIVSATATDGIVITDENRKVMHHNRRFSQIWDFPDAILMSDNRKQMLQFTRDRVENPDAYLERLREIIRQPKLRFEDTLKLKVGRVVECHTFPYEIEPNRVWRVWCYHEVTSEKTAQQLLAEKESWLQAILATLPVGVFIVDRVGKILDVNEVARQIWGGNAPRAETIREYGAFQGWWANTGKKVEPQDWPAARAIMKGEFVHGDVFEIERFDGSRRTTLNSAAPIRGEQNQIIGAVVVVQDVTRSVFDATEINREKEVLERTSEELDKKVQIRDDFIAIASHELKTPLTALKVQLQLIPKIFQTANFPEKENLVAMVRNSLKHLDHFSGLVNDLLDVSRIGAGRLQVDRQEMSLSETILSVLERYRGEIEEARCSLSVRLDDSIRGNWDPIRIEQVFVNLLTNALKYGAGTCLEIATRNQGPHAEIIVKDGGIGIAEEHQKKIFERFERVAPLSRFRGLGLGLYITRQIVLAHGGEIRVESIPGDGATFIVKLPMDR